MYLHLINPLGRSLNFSWVRGAFEYPMGTTVDGTRDCVNEFSKIALWGQMRTPPDCVQVLCTVQIGYLCHLCPRLPRERTNTQILESEKGQVHRVTQQMERRSCEPEQTLSPLCCHSNSYGNGAHLEYKAEDYRAQADRNDGALLTFS